MRTRALLTLDQEQTAASEYADTVTESGARII